MCIVMPRMSNVGNDETTGLPVFLYGEIRVRKLRERNVNTFSPSFELIEESLRSLKMTRMTRNTTDSLCLDSTFQRGKKIVCNFSLSSLQRETTTLCIFFYFPLSFSLNQWHMICVKCFCIHMIE